MIELHEEDKNYYNFFLRSLQDLADDKNPGKSRISDGKEWYCWFPEMYEDFMSSCEMIVKWNPLSTKQRRDLKKLYNLLENYDRYLPDRKKTDEEICKDPEWHKVRSFAKIVYDDLKNVKYLPDEKM